MIRKNLLLILFLLIAIVGFSQSTEQAKDLFYTHRLNSAENAFQNIITTGNADPEVYYWLGEVYMEEENFDAAKNIFQQGVAVANRKNYSPKDHPLIYIGMDHWKLSTGNKEEALNDLNSILNASKFKNADALLAGAKANIQSKNGDANLAIEWLKKAQKRDKKNPEIYTAFGDAYRELKDASEAYIYYHEALKADPSYAEAHYKLGEIFKNQKNADIFVQEFSEAANKNYTPALYELYDYYFYKGDFALAQSYLDRYIQNSDPSIHNAYRQADLYFVTKDYSKALNTARDIAQKEGAGVKPRIYKMIAYCYAESADSSTALNYIDKYFAVAKKEDYVMKDYQLKAVLLEKNDSIEDAVSWYEKAYNNADKETQKEPMMKKIANLLKEIKNYPGEAEWREKIFTESKSPSNVDLFNWGLSLYFADEYSKADSVFGSYSEKYPEQTYGYLWQARCNAAIDTTMENGSAVPYYQKLVDIAEKDSVKNRQSLITAYSYLGTYEANIDKDYPKALEYFEKVLAIDETNEQAMQVSETLKKWISKKDEEVKTDS